MPRIKICGITSLQDALNAVNLGADFLGFIFYKKSPRSITPAEVRKITRLLPKRVAKVGVFVNASLKVIKKIVADCGLDYVQLHGEEDAVYCRKLSGRGKKKIKIIKAFRIKDADSLKDITDYDVDLYLLDSFDENLKGGSGKSFNWNLVSKLKTLNLPLMLSGGLNHKNVKKAIKRLKLFAVDVSSGVEKTKRKKDFKLMRDFIFAAKEASL
jgi:phosphoribosylanthranilate isomerase